MRIDVGRRSAVLSKPLAVPAFVETIVPFLLTFLAQKYDAVQAC